MLRWVDPVPELKRQLARELVAVVEGQSQVWAAWATHMARSRMSEIRRGNLENVSLERLIQALSYAGHHAKITVTRRGKRSTWTEHQPNGALVAHEPQTGSPIGFID